MVLRRQLQEADIKKFKGKNNLKLQKAGETDYNYTVRENGVIYNDTTNQPTEYSLNSNF